MLMMAAAILARENVQLRPIAPTMCGQRIDLDLLYRLVAFTDVMLHPGEKFVVLLAKLPSPGGPIVHVDDYTGARSLQLAHQFLLHLPLIRLRLSKVVHVDVAGGGVAPGQEINLRL